MSSYQAVYGEEDEESDSSLESSMSARVRLESHNAYRFSLDHHQEKVIMEQALAYRYAGLLLIMVAFWLGMVHLQWVFRRTSNLGVPLVYPVTQQCIPGEYPTQS